MAGRRDQRDALPIALRNHRGAADHGAVRRQPALHRRRGCHRVPARRGGRGSRPGAPGPAVPRHCGGDCLGPRCRGRCRHGGPRGARSPCQPQIAPRGDENRSRIPIVRDQPHLARGAASEEQVERPPQAWEGNWLSVEGEHRAAGPVPTRCPPSRQRGGAGPPRPVSAPQAGGAAVWSGGRAEPAPAPIRRQGCRRAKPTDRLIPAWGGDFPGDVRARFVGAQDPGRIPETSSSAAGALWP